MIGNQDIQENIKSFIQNLIEAKVIEGKNFEELQKLNQDEVTKGSYTSCEKDLYALIKGTFECPILSELVTDPVALITQDNNRKQVGNIMSKESLDSFLNKANEPHINPFNRQEILKIVSPEGIKPFTDYQRDLVQRPVQLPQAEQAQPWSTFRQAGDFNSNNSSNLIMSTDFFDAHHKKIMVTTMAISSAIGFLIAGPIGAIALATGGFVLGLCIASLVDKGLRSYRASKESTNSPAENMPFLQRYQQNNNQSNESTSGIPNPT